MQNTGTPGLAQTILSDPETGLRWAMREYAALVRGVLRRVLPGKERDVEECMADVFVALWRNARTLADLPADPESDAAELVGVLVAAMEPPDRDIFLRKYYLLQSSREIAAALGLSVANVNTRLSRGRERLRRQLREGGINHA